MAIHTEDKMGRNEFIVKKVKEVLSNARFDRNVTIVIEAHRGEIPSIRYNITEDIVPETSNGEYDING